MAKLIVKRKANLVQVFELEPSRSQFTVGSHPDNDLVLSEKPISTRHLKIDFTNGNYYLETIPENVETFLNGRPLMKRVQIVQGDEIAIGDLRFLFVSHDSESVSLNSGEEMEVIDEHYLDKKFVTSVFSAVSRGEAAPNSEASVKTDVSEPQPESADDFFEVDDFEKIPDEPPTPQAAGDAPAAAKSVNGKTYQLTAIYGPYLGKKFPLKDGDTRIGRDNSLNDIVIRLNDKGALDPSISRRHVTISCKNGRFYVSDKRSKTRTYVNQLKLNPTDEIPIDEGDEIEIVSDQKSTIFRFSSAANTDFSPPRKAGVWWIRNALRLGTVLSILFGAILVSAIGLSCMNRLTASKKPDELKFIEEAWFQQSREAAALNPELRTSLALGDLNGDGKTDVIFSDSKHSLIALDGVTKKTIWMNEQIGVHGAIPIVLADLNSNGILDVLVAGRDSRLRALDGVNGAEMWLSPILGEAISGAPVAADLNGDGLKDIVAATATGKIHFGWAYVNEMDWKSVDSGMTIRCAPTAVDFNGDGVSEVLIGSDEGKLLIIDSSGRISKIMDIKEELSKASGESINRLEIHNPPAVADLNGNGILDIVVSANDWYLTLEGGSFSPLWYERLDAQPADPNRSAAVSGKFDADDLEDAALASQNIVKVLRGSADAQNRKLPAWQKDFGLDAIAAPIALADFNKDGVHDLVVTFNSGKAAIVNGVDGTILGETNSASKPAISSALIADVGGDGYLDILFIRKDHNLYKIQTNSSIDKNSVIWGQAFSNERNSCRYEFVRPQSWLYDVTITVSSVLFLSIFGVTTIARKKREQLIKSNQRL